MDQNTNVEGIKFGTTTPIKFMDKECGEVEVNCFGKFTYEVFNQDQFNAAAQGSNMDAETYARGILLSLLIEEINMHNGKLVFSLSTNIKGDKIIEHGNPKIQTLGFKFTSIMVESITPTEESEKKMKLIETTRIKSAITGREVVDANVEAATEAPVQEGEVKDDKSLEKGPSALPLIIMAVVAAVVMFVFFK